MLLSFIKLNTTSKDFVNSEESKNYEVENKTLICLKDKTIITFHNGKWFYYEHNKVTDKEVKEFSIIYNGKQYNYKKLTD